MKILYHINDLNIILRNVGYLMPGNLDLKHEVTYFIHQVVLI